MPDPTSNDIIAQALIRHQVGLMRYSSKVRAEIFELLDATEADLKRQILVQLKSEMAKPATPSRAERVARLFEAMRETRLKAWRSASAKWQERLNEVAQAEPKFVGAIIESAIPVELDFGMPSPAILRAIVTSKPFGGRTLKEWAAKLADDDVSRIETQVKIGMAQGETAVKIAKRIVGSAKAAGSDGAVQITRREAEGLTHTAVMSITGSARAALYQENADVIDGEVWLATLDSDTCPRCGGLDGEEFGVGEGPETPLHPRCRCIRVPKIGGKLIGERPTKGTTEKKILRDFARENGLGKAPKSRDGLPYGMKGKFDDFRRKSIGDATGTAPATLSYDEWIKTQSAEVQDDILGPTRAALMRKGDVSVKAFATPAGTKTLAQIAEQHAQAFTSAGLDATKFQKIATKAKEALASEAAASASQAVARSIENLEEQLPDLGTGPGGAAAYKSLSDDIAKAATKAAEVVIAKAKEEVRLFADRSSKEYEQAFKDWEDGVRKSAESVQAFGAWQTSGYRNIRRVQAGKTGGYTRPGGSAVEPMSTASIAEAKAHLEEINRQFDKAPLVKDELLYRGTLNTPQELARFAPGAEVTLDALSSWSRSHYKATQFGDTVLKAKISRSLELTRANVHSQSAEFAGELEHLVQAGHRFRVVSIELGNLPSGRSITTITLEEIL